MAHSLDVDAVALDQAHVGRQHAVALGIDSVAKSHGKPVKALQDNLASRGVKMDAHIRTDRTMNTNAGEEQN